MDEKTPTVEMKWNGNGLPMVANRSNSRVPDTLAGANRLYEYVQLTVAPQ